MLKKFSFIDYKVIMLIYERSKVLVCNLDFIVNENKPFKEKCTKNSKH